MYTSYVAMWGRQAAVAAAAAATGSPHGTTAMWGRHSSHAYNDSSNNSREPTRYTSYVG